MAEEQKADISVENHGAIAIVTLSRGRALNALTAAMRERISSVLWTAAREAQTYAVVLESESERAFSAGSDVREVLALYRQSEDLGHKAFADEYMLNWQCECFSKPTVPLINGMVMGGGVGVSLYGTHRVAGENYKFAMPETAIGLFPDVGVCYALGRMPGSFGVYLGLTGRSIGRADAYRLGLVTHCIGAEHFPAIKAELAEAWPVDPLLDRLHVDPDGGEIATIGDVVDRCFSASSVEEILERLKAIEGEHKAWADGVAAELSRRSPLSLKITLRHVRGSRERDLRETLVVDYRLAVRLLAAADFHEGVRAVIVDKDHQPKWTPSSLAEVTEAMVDHYFAPLGAGELALPTRAEMQSARA